ncbi:MAG: hypothetical protein JO138_19260 [Acidobacteriaceae bacterium]|nr:hypothetical protein [Acidobacteriaceae bacterium]
MGIRSKFEGYLIIAVLAASLSCAPPQTVATFAEAASGAITSGAPIFSDLYDSCVRRHQDAGPIVPVYSIGAENSASDPAGSVPPACRVFAGERDALIRMSAVLAAYFRAMQDLAEFGASSVAAPSAEAGVGASMAASLSTVQADSVSKLSGLVLELFTRRYQHERIATLLRTADPHVAVITRGLEKIVGTDYNSLLEEEERTLKRRYQRAGATTNGTAVVLLLDRAYSEDMRQLEQRRAFAATYVEALQQVRDGHGKLALNSAHLGSKQVGLALQPDISRLQGLAPQTAGISKGTHQ